MDQNSETLLICGTKYHKENQLQIRNTHELVIIFYIQVIDPTFCCVYQNANMVSIILNQVKRVI